KRVADDSLSISNNNILCLVTDAKGFVWAGTSGGVNKYQEKKDGSEHISLNGKKDGHIFSTCEDWKGQLSIGGAIGLVRRKDLQPSPVPFYSNTTVQAVFEDRRGKLWVGSEKGASFMEGKNTTRLDDLLTGVSAPRNVTAITEDAFQHIWIGTQNNGVYCFDPVSRSLEHYRAGPTGKASLINNNIRRIFQHKNKLLWIGTQEGISIVDPA